MRKSRMADRLGRSARFAGRGNTLHLWGILKAFRSLAKLPGNEGVSYSIRNFIPAMVFS